MGPFHVSRLNGTLQSGYSNANRLNGTLQLGAPPIGPRLQLGGQIMGHAPGRGELRRVGMTRGDPSLGEWERPALLYSRVPNIFHVGRHFHVTDEDRLRHLEPK